MSSVKKARRRARLSAPVETEGSAALASELTRRIVGCERSEAVAQILSDAEVRVYAQVPWQLTPEMTVFCAKYELSMRELLAMLLAEVRPAMARFELEQKRLRKQRRQQRGEQNARQQ